MLSFLRNARLQRTARSWTTAHSRDLNCSAILRQEETEKDDAEDVPAKERSGFRDVSFEQWLRTEGKKYETSRRPRNWLGGEVPFPLNRTFRPPPPISDRLRAVIYNEFMSNPAVYTVRTLSERKGISMQRVAAILRLKGLEENWRKGKPLQTGFLVGMEEILGITERKQTRQSQIELAGTEGIQELGGDASQADRQMEEGNDRARERYQRLFWEPVVEGYEPIIPAELERAATVHHEKAKQEASLKLILARVPPVKHETHIVEKEGRPPIEFVDVGSKYVDIDDRLRRLKESERRSQLKAKRRARKASLKRERAAVVAPAATD
ncbi:uncharacterized protein LAESUDRAFT_696657 [Laetiporus sulphureus 93-53]|uniref:Eukaryotic mitochondrial regulator protein-domain-containing protein n=1 Tax=Laetiporus sulphureus 93-53 TaxID=1314785 RepID=A0A165F812_9APHY|nr:uncharacterized protein LAESUDRAFT_696657 [Laetiporus sulphureus 93-53]KZT08569.1 hypothetical protein LAESUDRAFT_696657 [Laetiporus sulphureus 93-53]